MTIQWFSFSTKDGLLKKAGEEEFVLFMFLIYWIRCGNKHIKDKEEDSFSIKVDLAIVCFSVALIIVCFSAVGCRAKSACLHTTHPAIDPLVAWTIQSLSTTKH